MHCRGSVYAEGFVRAVPRWFGRTRGQCVGLRTGAPDARHPCHRGCDILVRVYRSSHQTPGCVHCVSRCLASHENSEVKGVDAQPKITAHMALIVGVRDAGAGPPGLVGTVAELAYPRSSAFIRVSIAFGQRAPSATAQAGLETQMNTDEDSPGTRVWSPSGQSRLPPGNAIRAKINLQSLILG